MKVWFQQHFYGWRTGADSSNVLPTVMVELYGKAFPTHETRVLPYSRELWISPTINDDHLHHGRMEPALAAVVQCRAPISTLLNSFFSSSHNSVVQVVLVEISGTSYKISISMFDVFDINSESVFPTVTKIIKDPTTLSETNQEAFNVSKRNELDFPLKKLMTSNLLRHLPAELDFQVFKLVFGLQTSSDYEAAKRSRAHFVSASCHSALRQIVHSGAPAFILSTVCMLACVPSLDETIPTTFQE